MSRILTLQRQVRELGRLRTGYTTGNRPVRSKTWIITSKEKELLEAAAQLWGGKVVAWTPLNSDLKQWSLTTETDRLPAFLPPGDPLTQANEMWSRGGVTRRCNGLVDLKSGQACVCRARFGDDFFTRPPTEVCKPYTRLNVMLLDLPDLGVWHHTTKSYYAAMEIAGMVDFIKARIGPEPTVPVWLIIDQRKSVKDGKSTPYPVPVITIRGSGESAAELLAGNVPTLELGVAPTAKAIGAGPAEEKPALPAAQPAKDKAPQEDPRKRRYLQLVKDAGSVTAVQALWREAKDWMDDELAEAMTAKAASFNKPTAPAEAAPAEEPADVDEAAIEGEEEPDPLTLSMQILAVAGQLGWSEAVLDKHARERFEGKGWTDINGWQMADFLKALKAGRVQ